MRDGGGFCARDYSDDSSHLSRAHDLADRQPRGRLSFSGSKQHIRRQWQSGKQFAAAQSGSDVYYDVATGTVVQISQQSGLQKVGEIAKFFAVSNTTSKDAAGLM